MKSIMISCIIIITTAMSINALEIKPDWNEKDEFIYTIEITDERPPAKNKRHITQSVFKISLKVLKKSDTAYTLEWKYLPVTNPISKCPLEDKNSCYSWTNDIKQNLKMIFNTSIKGTYISLDNPDEVGVRR